MALGSTFALADVRYGHDGSETTADAFDLVVCDGTDLCSPVTTVPVVVAPVNDPPAPQPDVLTVAEGATVVVDLLANDSDPDSVLRPDLVETAAPAATGELVVDATGLTFVHDGAEVTSDAFTYRLCDPEGACAEAEVAVTVLPVNDAPAPVADLVRVEEGGTVVFDPLANDVDPDSSLSVDALTLRSVPEGAAVSVVPGGLQVVHDGGEPPAPGEPLPSFAYRICDDEGACGDGVVELDVQPVNDAPTAADDAVTVEEGGRATVDVLANDADVDDTNLVVELLDIPPSLELAEGPGGLEVQHDGSEPLGPSPVVRYQACDAAGACAEAELTVRITPVDDPPVAADDVATVGEGERTWVSVLANDLDADSVLAQVTLAELPAHGTATAVAGLVEYVHDGSETRSDAFGYEVCDAQACATARVALTVRPTDDLPEVADDRYAGPSPLEVSAAAGVLANDRDDDGALGEVELVEPPLYGTVILETDGGFVYEADNGYEGADRFVYAVDGVQGAVWLEVEAGRGCGCTATPAPPWPLLPLLPLALRRRRPIAGAGPSTPRAHIPLEET